MEPSEQQATRGAPSQACPWPGSNPADTPYEAPRHLWVRDREATRADAGCAHGCVDWYLYPRAQAAMQCRGPGTLEG